MKTIADAHEALIGDLSNSCNPMPNTDRTLHFSEDPRGYFCSSSWVDLDDSSQYICTIKEFNNYKSEAMKPVYTNQMRDDDVLPEIGLNCLLSKSRNSHDGYSAFVAGNNAGEQVYITAHFETRTGLKMAAYFSNNENKRFGGVACAIAFAPIDTRTDKEKAIDSIYDAIYANKVIHNSIRDGRDDSIIEAVLNVAHDEWVGK